MLQVIKIAYSGLPAAVWYFSVVTLINRAGTMVLTFLTLYLTRDRGYSEAVSGLLFSVYGGGAVIGTWLGGRLTDRIGPMKTIYFSFFSAGLAMLSIEMFTTTSGLVLGLFLMGLCGEAYRPAGGAAIAAACPPQKRVRAYGLNRLAINLGFSVGPAIGGLLATHNYAWLFRVDGITCILAGGLMFLMPRLGGGAFEVAKGDPKENEPDPVVSSPWKDRRFMAFMFLVLIAYLMFFQLFTTWPLFIRTGLGLSEQKLGMLMTLNGLMIITMEMVLIHKVEDFEPLKVIGFGSMLTGLGLFILVIGGGWPIAVLSTVLWTLSEMLSAPTMSSYVANLARDGNRGHYLGIFNSAMSLGYLVSPILGSWIYTAYGPTVLWFLCGLTGLVVWIGFPCVRFVRQPSISQDKDPG